MSVASVALPPGTMLGNYKLLKALGQGGFGITYIAWDNQLKRNIALKECFPLGLCCRDADTGMIAPLPHIEPQLYRGAMEALKKEAQTLASLNHERIVRVYDVFEAHGSVFYVMPWLEGGSLKERMAEAANGGAPITSEQAREWLLRLLDGLEYLHAKGIYHRDIKPANILFDERGMPVLIDFGAALNKPDATQTISQGEFSYAYAAPEQVTGKGEIGPWTDFYSLAATWYALISGHAVEQSLQRLMQDDLTPLAVMKPAPCADKALLVSIDKNLNLPAAKRCQAAAEWRAFFKQNKLQDGSFTKKMLWWGLLAVLISVPLTVYLWLGKAEPPLIEETSDEEDSFKVESTPKTPDTEEVTNTTPEGSASGGDFPIKHNPESDNETDVEDLMDLSQGGELYSPVKWQQSNTIVQTLLTKCEAVHQSLLKGQRDYITKQRNRVVKQLEAHEPLVILAEWDEDSNRPFEGIHDVRSTQDFDDFKNNIRQGRLLLGNMRDQLDVLSERFYPYSMCPAVKYVIATEQNRLDALSEKLFLMENDFSIDKLNEKSGSLYFFAHNSVASYSATSVGKDSKKIKEKYGLNKIYAEHDLERKRILATQKEWNNQLASLRDKTAAHLSSKGQMDKDLKDKTLKRAEELDVQYEDLLFRVDCWKGRIRKSFRHLGRIRQLALQHEQSVLMDFDTRLSRMFNSQMPKRKHMFTWEAQDTISGLFEESENKSD